MSRCLAERSPAPSGQAGALRPWHHHVWQLGADPAQWPQELAQHQRRQPVFAVVSGISGGAWSPIHQFCEREKMPCVLPNTAAVDDRQASHWSFYFSRGASLEAAALAERIADEMPAGGWRRIVQRTDGSEAAQLAADALQRHLRELGIHADIDQQIHDPHNDALLGASLTGRDALVLWLNPTALRQFTATAAAPRAGRVIFSGELGGLDEAPVAQAWRERAWMLYPYEAAGRRNARIELNTGHWMARQGLELQPALSRLQGNTYSACEVSVRALQTMRERYSRAYFVELLEAADEAAVATAYPRFTLGPAQRHGSRGAFIMQYQAPDFTRLTPTGDWIVPSH
jgi:Periplasmic binding protein